VRVRQKSAVIFANIIAIVFFETRKTLLGKMLENHRHLLLKFRREIVEDLLVDDVVVFLQSKFVLDSDDIEVIRGEQTSRRQAEMLLDILPKKGYESFEHFFTALSEKYPHLARLLESGASEDGHNNVFEGIDSPLQCEYISLLC